MHGGRPLAPGASKRHPRDSRRRWQVGTGSGDGARGSCSGMKATQTTPRRPRRYAPNEMATNHSRAPEGRAPFSKEELFARAQTLCGVGCGSTAPPNVLAGSIQPRFECSRGARVRGLPEPQKKLILQLCSTVGMSVSEKSLWEWPKTQEDGGKTSRILGRRRTEAKNLAI